MDQISTDLWICLLQRNLFTPANFVMPLTTKTASRFRRVGDAMKRRNSFFYRRRTINLSSLCRPRNLPA